jgi:hypothetical protein
MLYLVASFQVCDALANPTVLDDERRPVAMLSENVMVTVGAGKSLVNGQFRFQQEPPFARKHTHVTIFVPIFLPDALTAERYVASNGSPRVEIAGRSFVAVRWDDITLEGSPDEVRLPRGWRMEIFVCNVPLRNVSPGFDVTVTYTQLHFPRDIVGYVPIRPPLDRKSCQITFSSEKGREVSPMSWFPPFSSGKHLLQFTPRDRKLIQVQSRIEPDRASRRMDLPSASPGQN